MGRYSQEYGLEDDKNNPDGTVEGGKKTYYCIFTDAEYKRGFYLGFAHFIASKKALKLMATSEPEAPKEAGEDCFRCHKVPEKMYYLASTSFGICPGCVALGLSLIDLPPEPRPEKPEKEKRRPPKPALPILRVPAFELDRRSRLPGTQLALFG